MTVSERIERGDAEAKKALSGRAHQDGWTVCHAILALGHYVAALAEGKLPPEPAEEPQEAVWARVELFGHSVRYGRVAEVEFAGRRFLEVVEPEGVVVDEGEGGARTIRVVFPERRKRYHPNAVYAFEELPEEDVRAAFYSTHGLFKHEDGSWRERPTRAYRDDDEDDLF